MARENNRPQRKNDRDDGLCKKLIAVNRITKVVKGGRKMRFSALVVIGDENGRVGCGSGKANEVPEAIEKATAQAKKAMKKVSLVGTSIPHTVVGKFGRGSVLMMPAAEGTGVIAGGPARIVLELAGVQNIRTKSLNSNNKNNVVAATIEGLKGLYTPEEIARKRGKTVAEILG